MKKIRLLLFCIFSALILVGCSINKKPDVPVNNEISNFDKHESIDEPAEAEGGELQKVTSPLLNDEAYTYHDFIWLNDHEVLVFQIDRATDQFYRLIAYDVADASEQLFFSWENEQYHESAVFKEEDRIKVYSDHCLYELDMSGAVVGETEYAPTYGQLSLNGDYVERFRGGNTYIIDAFTDIRRKIFDNTDETFYHPISFGWSSDGQYFVLDKEERKTVKIPDTKPDSFFVPTGVVIVDKEGNPVLTIPSPLEWNGYYIEWLYGTHEIALLRHPDTENPLGSLMVVDADSGEEVGSYDFTNRETICFNIGKKDCILLIDAVTYDENNSPAECDTYIYNYQTREKEFFFKFHEYPGRALFSPDGQHAVIVVGYDHNIYLYNDL